MVLAQGQTSPEKPNFDVIAPPKNRRKAIPAEPNMTLVELQCEIGRAHV